MTALRDATDLPIHLRTHDTSGAAAATALEALKMETAITAPRRGVGYEPCSRRETKGTIFPRVEMNPCGRQRGITWVEPEIAIAERGK